MQTLFFAIAATIRLRSQWGGNTRGVKTEADTDDVDEIQLAKDAYDKGKLAVQVTTGLKILFGMQGDEQRVDAGSFVSKMEGRKGFPMSVIEHMKKIPKPSSSSARREPC